LAAIVKSQGASVQSKNDNKPLNPMQTLQHVAKSIDDVIEKAFGEKKPKPKVNSLKIDYKVDFKIVNKRIFKLKFLDDLPKRRQ
jgi:hypothetical protein